MPLVFLELPGRGLDHGPVRELLEQLHAGPVGGVARQRLGYGVPGVPGHGRAGGHLGGEAQGALGELGHRHVALGLDDGLVAP